MWITSTYCTVITTGMSLNNKRWVGDSDFFSGAAESEDAFDARDDVLPSDDTPLGFCFPRALDVSFLRRVDSDFLVASESWSIAGEYRYT